MPVGTDLPPSNIEDGEQSVKLSPKTSNRAPKRSLPVDENQSPNEKNTPNRKTRASARQSTGKQPTMLDMFSKKRPREEEENDQRAVKPKVDDEMSLEIIIKTPMDFNKDALTKKVEDSVASSISLKTNEKVEEIPVVSKNDTVNTVNKDNADNKDNTANKNNAVSKSDAANKDNAVNKDNAADKDEDVKMDSVEEDNTKKDVEKMENKETVERCASCCQIVNDPEVKYYHGHPQDSVEEYIALTDEKLVLTTSDEGDITERPHVNITGFSLYDREGHLCPIDGGLIESDVRLFMSGYLKSICSDSPDIDSDSLPVKEVGPIVEWGIHGFDGGQQNCIILSTAFGEYNLLKPSEEYTCVMGDFYERIRISKVTIEYLEEFHYLQPTYEDLLLIIKESSIPELNDVMMTEEMLHKHARYICDQVVSLEVDDEDEPPLITLPCMRELIKLFGIKFGKRQIKPKLQHKKKVAAASWTKATTTSLVRNTFEMFFSNQLDQQAEKDMVLRRKRCGICDTCQLPDCGKCSACRAMGKFGGTGKTKKACVQRNCPNMAVEQAEESDPEDEEEYRQLSEKNNSDSMEDGVPVKLTGAGVKNIQWIGEPVKSEMNKMYYEKVEINDLEVQIGDFVMVDTMSPSIPHLVTKITYMWKEAMTPKAGFFHGQVFFRASESVLGEVGDPREVFLADRCCNGAPLSSVLRLAHVEKREIPADWFNLGGEDDKDELLEDDGKNYYYQKYYDKLFARFEDLPSDPPCANESRKHRFCPSCDRKSKKYALTIPKVINKLEIKSESLKESNKSEWEAVKWREFEFKKGGAVFLKPGTFKFKNMRSEDNPVKSKIDKVDETIYTEYYRKSDSNMRGSNVDTVEPFCVGYIEAVLARGEGPLINPQDIYLKVNVLYRPENTSKEDYTADDLNMVYWSDEQREIQFSAVMGPCKLVHIDNIPDETTVAEWSAQDFNRFYFRQAYHKVEGKFIEAPESAKSIGNLGIKKGKLKGKGKGKGTKVETDQTSKIEEVKVEPLKTLDVFAGCGGLSEGLHQSGIAVSHWAIESMSAAARAYQLNNPKCTVYTEDCNALLKGALDGSTHSTEGLLLPKRGEVELLCGGPPCQGFSGMNRFNSREYSNFKNSLVASYLSYCDYYRPKYFILENVRNFVAFKKGMVLKLTLRCLLKMGYQCTFGVVQAGNYGVPQTRRRLIILASAPGYGLPLYPEPTHVFSRRACTLSVAIDGKRFNSNIIWDESAPRRTCTIRDAMSDLPFVSNGAVKPEIDYGSNPESHFQRMIRSKDPSTRLRDHICKNMAPLIQARITRIPTTPGSDWRDLPNVAVTLSDGSRSKVLQYRHHDTKNGRGANGALRGVCACASRRPCEPMDKQDNTLIPWCLPHTGNRHNNWAGLYGRVSWDGYFSTTVTDPEPMGKQGRVLHPEQPRVVTVRECARSQGFPDTYTFAGTIQDKHRQIGNAVPPPLGAALGREIRRTLVAKS